MMLIYTTILSLVQPVDCQKFSEVLGIYEKLEHHSSHFVDVRPVLDQSDVVNVSVGFSMLNILEVAELSQSVTFNVYFHLMWKDEVMAWNSSHYGGVTAISVGPNEVWRPRLVVINSVGQRELYKDDDSPLQVEHTGQVSWMPGGPIATSCSLDLSKYPVDDHICYIKLTTMSFHQQTVHLIEEHDHHTSEMYIVNTEWELKAINKSIFNYLVDGVDCSGLQINVYFKRRPISLLLGYIIPVTFISFLNLFVFLIPAESGEKVNAGITVLLSQAMYMSTMSSMLPRSTNPLPVVTYYLFLLIINSALIVFLCIIISALHNWERRMTKKLLLSNDMKRRFEICIREENMNLKGDVDKMAMESPHHFLTTPELSEVTENPVTGRCTPCHKTRRGWLRWVGLSEMVNRVAFFVLFGVWLCATISLVIIIN
ncbi:hypothetical protein Btru_053808 [Bulinus truncatus]|nr:hypothetical protein Btru_053808 [Bulinus truncatus]